MWALLASGRLLPWGLLALGLSAISVGVVAVSAPKGVRALHVGMLALVLVVVTGTITVGSVMRQRVAIDRSTDDLTAEDAEHARKAVYDETLTLAKLGGALAAIGLVLGAAAVVRGALADYAEAEKNGESDEWTIPLGAAVLAAIALFSTVAAATPLVMGMPGKNVPAAQKKIADAEKLLEAGSFSEGCSMLEQAFQEGAAVDGPRKDTIGGLVTECFNQRIDRALASEPGARKTELEGLKASKLPLDDAQRKRVDEELTHLAKETTP